MGRAVRGCAQAVAALLLVLGSTLGLVSSAAAFEFLDGKLQVHGVFEEQIRSLSRDFDPRDGFDLAQWYHVFSVEIDYDVAPNGWGPFDFVSMFLRAEGRYDCVWARGCGLFSSANAFGNRAQRLPERLSDARERGFVGTIPDGDSRRLLGQRRDELQFGFRDRPVGDRHRPGAIWDVDGLQDLFAEEGPDDLLETFDDPAPYVFQRFLDYRFASRKIQGPTDGVGVQMLGPWLPKNELKPIGALRDRANPFRGAVDAISGQARSPDVHPVLTYPNLTPGAEMVGATNGFLILDGKPIIPGFDVTNPTTGLQPDGTITPRQTVAVADLEKPFRPAPECAFDGPCEKHEAQGLFYPNPAVAKLIREDAFDDFDQNFRQAALALNRGASQEDEKELKELYVDLELFDSRLWVRAGKQNIVWGKTELFRTTDQFNPQDFGLATLPTLEESRIALWGVRGVWSFYDVGFLHDTRLEVAFNFDQFEPVDLGRCGEPFTINLVCLKTLGLFAHGIVGVGLAGEIRPPDPWDSLKGLEGGARLEFRIGRFSFQLSDFYGYSDFPTIERIFTYERNVDPSSGLLRRAEARGPCRFTSLNDPFGVLPDRSDPDCLQPGSDALRNHPANQSLFAVACGATIGFNLLEPSSCGTAILNSQQRSRAADLSRDPSEPPVYFPSTPVPQFLSLLLSGSPLAKFTLATFLGLNSSDIANSYIDWNADGLFNLQDVPFVALVRDCSDPSMPGDPVLCPDDRPDLRPNGMEPDLGLDGVLTSAQEALLGCGPFFEVRFQVSVGLVGCHFNGIDLLNAEASALVQSWTGFDGEVGRGFDDFVAAAMQDVPVAGTQGFAGGPVCTRFENGQVVVLPGCRGPGDAGYEVRLDGTPPNAFPGALGVDVTRHPFACKVPGVPGSLAQPRDPNSCQPWRSEMAALSWNFLVALVMLSGAGELRTPENLARIDFFDSKRPFADDKCSFKNMHLCFNVQLFWNALGTRRATVRAGGRNGFGRRDFAWHQGGSVVLRYEKRNVLGFAFDFAEDVTKSNWGVELSWIEGNPFVDNDQFDGLSRADTFNMTVSVDRPTFINFLNSNRTFFFNSQWFFQYIRGYRKGFTFDGPYNVLGTFTVLAGYFQDRLLPQITFVYDVRSNSGGVLSQLTYRFSERFSASFGINSFVGRFEPKTAPINDVIPNQNRVGRRANKEMVENLLSLFRDKDEVFLAIRYTY